MTAKIHDTQNNNSIRVLFSFLCFILLAFSSNAQSEFITKWQTTNASESISIPITGAGYNYSVDWGDGNTDVSQTSTASHTYTVADTYTVTITGDFPRIYFNNTDDKDKLLSIEQWGTGAWTSMNAAFFGCSNLIINADDSPNLNSVTDLSSMFENATSLNQDIGFWNTSNVTNMSSMFRGASSFNQDIGFWNINNVTDISNMFRDASKFNRDISGWNTSEVLDMTRTFQNAVNFNQDIFLWNVESVTACNAMFIGAALSTSNYDALLIAWLAQDLNEGVLFHVGNSVFCSTAAQAAKALLITPAASGGKGWIVVDGGKCSSLSFGRANEYITIFENTTDVAVVRAINPTVSAITYAITAGTDAAKFSLGSISGNLEFIAPPVFDTPLDANGDNIYEVEVTATVTATSDTDIQTLSVDVTENSAIIWEGGTDTLWTESTNWLGGVVPTSSDRVRIINGSANYPVIASDVEVKSLELLNLSASLTIDTCSLTIIESLNISSGVLTVESEASLLPLGTASGSINVKRNTTFGKTEDRYSVVGSPVTVGVTSVLGNPIYEYDETIPYDDGGSNGGDRFVLIDAITTMDVGDAYFSANVGKASFFGPPNTGNINVSLVYDFVQDGAEAGFNLVSNPYTASISYVDFAAANSDIDGTIYLWDDGGSDVEQRGNADYVTANSMGAASGGSGRAASWDGYIRSAQGFFVKATSAGTLNFTPSMMSIGNNSDDGFFRKEKPVVMKFVLSSENNFNEILIGFTDKATKEIDRTLDAHKVKSSSDLQFYSRLDDAILAIQALPLLDEATTVDLGFDIKEAGIYTINLKTETRYDFLIYLKDNLLNQMIDLSDNSTYSFETKAVQNSNRFSLVFSPNRILDIEESIIKNEMIVFSNDNELNIRMNRDLKNAKVSIYNLSGTLVKEDLQIDFTGEEWTTTFSQKGLFIITVQTDEKVFVKKFVK